MIPPAQFQALLGYPGSRFGTIASDRWVSLCERLANYVVPNGALSIDSERKWELVSALQKTIRRGDKEMVLNVIAAINTMSTEYAYF